jgi:phage-related minor tail protein
MTTRTDELLIRLRVEADQALKPLKNVEGQVKKTQQAFNTVGKNSKRFSSGLQNAGYQIQDFAVQVGSGTDAVRAFSQQAPQLLSAFGLLGVAAGTAVAVFAPLVKEFFNLGDASEEAASALKSFDSILSNISSSGGAFDKYAKLLEKADDETKSWVTSIFNLQRGLKELELSEAQKELDNYISSLTQLNQGQRGGPNPTLTLIRNIKEEFKIDDNGIARQILELAQQAESGAISANEFSAALNNLALTSDLSAESVKRLAELVGNVNALNVDSASFIATQSDNLQEAIDLWDDYMDALGRTASAYKDSLDPMRAYNREVKKLGELLAAELITLEEYNALIARLRGELLQPIKVTVKPVKIDETNNDLEGIKAILQELQTEAGKWSDQFADTLVSGLADGKLAFKDFADYVLQQLARIAISKTLEPLFQGFGDFIGGLAGASAPVPAGLIATPVNDLPLSREASSAQQMIVGVPRMSAPSPSSSPVTVNVMNYGSDDVEVNERKTSRGIEVDVLIKNAVKSGIAAGDFDKVMATSFGTRRMAY